MRRSCPRKLASKTWEPTLIMTPPIKSGSLSVFSSTDSAPVKALILSITSRRWRSLNSVEAVTSARTVLVNFLSKAKYC
ncbi:F0F1 ATP synthase subunit alpha [Crocosphaera chwakensis CCY0110]|uniref:F0F1 ATP synthase subunit alpha n=1 Tax=Crocosphaera chwakensis CCY0110 TaxID=391612 RepID=A3IIR9_9CHRO|nr:F0F1 ATP synthase subunit alpha [Crocosphaera chwakensis CCY0110]